MRKCKNEGCPNKFEPNRFWQKFCRTACKQIAWHKLKIKEITNRRDNGSRQKQE